MAHPEPKIPERFECVRGRRAHLQLQFIIKRDGGIYMGDRAYIFRNDKGNLEDLKISSFFLWLNVILFKNSFTICGCPHF